MNVEPFEIEMQPQDTVQPWEDEHGWLHHSRDRERTWVKMTMRYPKEDMRHISDQLRRQRAPFCLTDVNAALIRLAVERGELISPWGRYVIGRALIPDETPLLGTRP